MRMYRHDKGIAPHGAAGAFTAVELIVVVSIMAVILGLSGPLFKNLLQGNRLDNAVRVVQTAVRAAQNLAISSQTEACLLPKDNKTLQVCLVTRTALHVGNRNPSTPEAINVPFKTGQNTLAVLHTLGWDPQGGFFVGRQDLTNAYAYEYEYTSKGDNFLKLSGGVNPFGVFPAGTNNLNYLNQPVFQPRGDPFVLPDHVRLLEWSETVDANDAYYTYLTNASNFPYWTTPAADAVDKKRLYGFDYFGRQFASTVNELATGNPIPVNDYDDFITFNHRGRISNLQKAGLFMLVDETTLDASGQLVAGRTETRIVMIDLGGTAKWIAHIHDGAKIRDNGAVWQALFD